MADEKKKADYKDEPVPESKWGKGDKARSYKDAVTDEHREHLAEHGLAVE